MPDPNPATNEPVDAITTWQHPKSGVLLSPQGDTKSETLREIATAAHLDGRTVWQADTRPHPDTGKSFVARADAIRAGRIAALGMLSRAADIVMARDEGWISDVSRLTVLIDNAEALFDNPDYSDYTTGAINDAVRIIENGPGHDISLILAFQQTSRSWPMPETVRSSVVRHGRYMAVTASNPAPNRHP